MVRYVAPFCLNQRGFSYAEVLLSVVLLAVLLAPALQALSSGIAGNPTVLAARQLNLRSKMEDVLSQTFRRALRRDLSQRRQHDHLGQHQPFGHGRRCQPTGGRAVPL